MRRAGDDYGVKGVGLTKAVRILCSVVRKRGGGIGSRSDGCGGVQVDDATAMGHPRGGNRNLAEFRQYLPFDESQSDATLGVSQSESLPSLRVS